MAERQDGSMGVGTRKVVAVVCTAMLALCLAACGKAGALSGTYAMATNHTVEFSADGSCVMQDNGVSWPGTYEYDQGSGTYKLTVNGFGGSVETYTFTRSGDDLVLHQNGYDFVYEKQ